MKALVRIAGAMSKTLPTGLNVEKYLVVDLDGRRNLGGLVKKPDRFDFRYPSKLIFSHSLFSQFKV
jgi:hypothetical protein